ncbi:hypothetical protein J6590_073714 [Homalodisca vitripennis]|nr:hypothetical protein J6590_073714 [Homalodisca vitripennis]
MQRGRERRCDCGSERGRVNTPRSSFCGFLHHKFWDVHQRSIISARCDVTRASLITNYRGHARPCDSESRVTMSQLHLSYDPVLWSVTNCRLRNHDSLCYRGRYVNLLANVVSKPISP